MNIDSFFETLENPKETGLIEIFEKYGICSDIDDILKRIDTSKKLILFGAGRNCEQLYGFLQNKGYNNISLCDNSNKPVSWGKDIELIPVSNLVTLKEQSAIIITSSYYYTEIFQQLETLGLAENVIGIVVSVFSKSLLKNHRNEISKVFNLLGDDKSKKVFLNIFKWYITYNPQYISSIAEPSDNEYFEQDILNLSDKEVFVDGGAYDGDTTKQFIKRTDSKFAKAILFEPEENTFLKLQHNIEQLHDDRIIIHKQGLYKDSAQLRFNMGNGMGSSISDNGGVLIDAVPLDLYYCENITFIKLDLEGADAFALEGAKKIIQDTKPKIAVCVYHKTEDMWEIPLYIQSLRADYKLYLRHYSDKGLGTVCYAI